MKIVILLVTVGFLIGAYKKNKSISNPYVAFNILWVGVAALINIGNKYVYEPSTTAMTCIFIGIMGFNLSRFTPKLVLGKIKTPHIDAYDINYRRAYIFSIVVLILSALSAASAIQSFMGGASFSSIRSDYYTYASGESVYMYYFRNYVLSPLRYVVIISAIIGVLQKKKVSKWLLINTIGIIILQAITNGGRYVLMNTIFMIICGYSLFRNKDHITVKQKMIIAAVIALFSYVIVFLTNDRATFITQNMTVGERLYHTVYEYFAGSTTYLGEVVRKTPSIVGSTHGINFIAGYIMPLFVVLNFLHLIPYPAVFTVIGTYACEVLQIGSATYYNAMPTIFGYFFIDGGYVLVFVESWLFGYICKRLYLRGKSGNMLMSAMYILIFIQICNSSTRWFFYSSDYCLAYLYLNTVVKKYIGGGYELLVLFVICELLWYYYSNNPWRKTDAIKDDYCGEMILVGKRGVIA